MITEILINYISIISIKIIDGIFIITFGTLSNRLPVEDRYSIFFKITNQKIHKRLNLISLGQS